MKEQVRVKKIKREENLSFSSFLSTKEIMPYYGMRVLFMFLVGWFHVWQQSWLTPYIQLGSLHIDLSFVVRSGYIFVDGLILLSGFLLFLPYAKAMESDRKLPNTKTFFKNRISRIIPSYYFVVFFITVFVAVPLKQYANTKDLVKDVTMHLSFTHVFTRQTYYYSPINGALWTLAVEMQGYLIFPLLAKSFTKKPILTYLCLFFISLGYRGAVYRFCEDSSMWFNQLPAFLDVYANGMLAAWLVVKGKRYIRESWKKKSFAFLTFMICAALVVVCMKKQAAASGGEGIRQMQMILRYPLTALLSIMLVVLPFAFNGFQFFFGNNFMRFLAQISFNYYMWHQTLAVWLKKWGIPKSISEVPNTVGEQPWQNQYTFLCFALAIVVATILTYGIEKPPGQWLSKKFSNIKKAGGDMNERS